MTDKTPHEVVAKPKIHAKSEAKLRAQAEMKRNKHLDTAKLILAALVVAASVWGFYALAQQLPVYVRALLPAVGVAIALAIVFFWCDMGRRLTAYVKDATAEMKKVVWPERNETLKMSLFVVLFVAVLAAFILAADSLISWLFFDLLLKRG